MSDNTLKRMIKEYKKLVQIPFEEYKEKTKKDKKEDFQFMVHKMANEDIKLFESLEISNEYTEMIEEELEKYKSIIKEVREYIEDLAEDTEDYIGSIDRRRKVELLEILDKEKTDE